MRKDVKIIMAVCVIVLVGLIVYALFLPGEKKGEATTENANENTTAVNSEAPATTEPSVAEEPTTQPAENGVAISPTTMPSETEAVAAGTNDWNKLLNTGTATPDNGSPMTNSESATTPVPTPGMSKAPTQMTESPVALMNTDSASGRSVSEASATGTHTYTIKSGDTPTSIAQAEYGNGNLYPKILAANPKLNARHMRVGQRITLPELGGNSGAASAGNGATVGSMSDATAAEKSDTATSTAQAGAHYTVASGDSLQRISTKLYGSSSQWEKIYDLNKSKIGSNPGRLRVGMVLALPKAPSHATRATAAQ